MIIKYQKQRENPSWSIGLSENKADLDLRAKSNRRLRGRGGGQALIWQSDSRPPPSFRSPSEAKSQGKIMDHGDDCTDYTRDSCRPLPSTVAS